MGGPEERGGPGRGAPRSLEPGGGQRPGGGSESGQPAGGGRGGVGEPRREGPARRLEPQRSALRDVGTQVSWEGHAGGAGEAPQAQAGGVRGSPGGWGAPPAREGPGDPWGPSSGPPGGQSKAVQDKRASWPGGLCEGCGAPKERGEPSKGGTPRLASHRAWDLGVRAPQERLEDSMGLLALGVSRSLSGGLPGHAGAKRDSGGWLPKEWPRDPAQASGEVWVPRKPARPPERTGLPWLKEGAVPRKSGAAERSQVWIPREKPAPAGGGASGDVWVHKVRNPSGTGIMWVWAKVTNCSEEEAAVNEARVWTFQKEGPRKGGQGEGGYGVS